MPHNQPKLLVADSFRVRAHPASGESEVRNLHAHFARFQATAIEAWQSAEIEAPAGPEEDRDTARRAMRVTGIQQPHDARPADADPACVADGETPEQRRVRQLLELFLDDTREKIAKFGAGWPRLELWGVPDELGSFVTQQELRLSLRSLPGLSETLECRTSTGVRVPHAQRKGPNIANYAALNRKLRAEALLTDDSGRVVEGSTTSLVSWRNGVLCVSPDGGRVASVTEYILRDVAPTRGITVQFCRMHPAELSRYETWAVNALHGIRTVTSIDGIRLPSPDEDRLREFRAALDAVWQPVLG